MLSCLYSVIRNTSGVPLHLGFLSQQGVTLAADEEYSVAGDLATRVASSRQADRSFPSLEAALDAVRIVLLRTPAVHLYDDTTSEIRALALSGGVLGTVEPCWGSYSESVAVA